MSKPDLQDDEDLRERGEKVLEKVRRLNQRDLYAAIARERSRRTDDEIKAAYAQAMAEKAGKP